MTPRRLIGANRIQGAVLNDHEDRQTGRSSGRASGQTNEFSEAMARLEKAVQELVTTTTGEITGRATSLLDDTSKRIEAEVRLKRVFDEHPEEKATHERRRRRHRSRHRFIDTRRGEELYIDSSDEKVAGVCAALARYFGLENWVVRIGALSGLIFMPGVIFPAYWIAYFVMEKRTDGARRRRRGRRGRRRDREDKDRHSGFDAQPQTDAVSRSKARGRGRRGELAFNAGRSLRHITTDMTQAELRLRRLESFVTSDQYELHKELTRIEKEGTPDASR